MYTVQLCPSGSVLWCYCTRLTGCNSVRRSPLCLLVCQGDVLGGVSLVGLVGKITSTHHDPEEAFLLDIPSVVFVNLDNLLNTCADWDEQPSRLGQLVNQVLWYCWSSRPNVNAVVRASNSITCRWR